MGREKRRALVTSVILAAVLLASAGVLGVVAGTQHTPSIQSTSFEGTDVLDAGNTTTLWNNGSYELRASVRSQENPYEICTRGMDGNATSCQYVRLENGTQSLRMTAFPWDENATGRATVNVTIGSPGSSKVHDFVEREVRLLDPDGDIDGDGLDNRAEVEHGTNMTLRDTDRDGLDDGAEVNNYGTDPDSNDSDDDGLTDAEEISGRTDPTDPDTDSDGLTDGREVNDVDTDPTQVDSDDDGLVDGAEVERYGTDPSVADTDDDGVDDGREVSDPDGDPLDADAPRESIAEDVQGILPTAMGHSLLVLLLVALVGAAIAVGVSSIRHGRLRDHLWADEEPVVDDEPFRDADPPATPVDRSQDRTATPILTDEERVLRMLHENGGQVKQQRIVAETDWSKSKVSRLLSRMADEDSIRKITLGRENVIRLPADDDQAETPHADLPGRDRS